MFAREELNGDSACPIYMYRWTLFRCKRFKIYLHYFIDSDWAIDPHDHPKNFISIGLIGKYYELVYDKNHLLSPNKLLFTAPWIRNFPATHIHRIELINKKPVWTICIVGKAIREWGFYYRFKEWIKWDQYVYYKGEERKACK